MTSSLKVWIVEIGEPLLIEKNIRLLRNTSLAKYLSSKGHDVTLFTSTFGHRAKKQFFTKDCELEIEGIKNIFIKALSYNHNISFKRILHNKVFSRRFFNKALTMDNPDIIVAPIPVIENAESALKLAKIKKAKIVVDIRDNWPKEIVNLAPPPLRFLASLFFYRSKSTLRKILQSSDAVISISKVQTNYINEVLGNIKIRPIKIPLGYPAFRQEEIDDAIKKESKWIEQIGLKTKNFNVSFIGTMSYLRNLHVLFETAKEMPQVRFFIAGKGNYYLKYRKNSKNIKNIKWLGHINKTQIQSLLAHSHLGLAIYNNASMSLPNKPFEYLAFGLPVIHSLKGELETYLEKYKCGRYFHHDSVIQLVEAIKYYYDSPEKLAVHKKNAYKCFLENFTHDIIFKKYEDVLQSLIKK